MDKGYAIGLIMSGLLFGGWQVTAQAQDFDPAPYIGKEYEVAFVCSDESTLRASIQVYDSEGFEAFKNFIAREDVPCDGVWHTGSMYRVILLDYRGQENGKYVWRVGDFYDDDVRGYVATK